MPIIINIDVMLARRKMSVTALAEKVGITMANISILKNGKAKAIRLSTLEAICKALECQPGDILEYKASSVPGEAPRQGLSPPRQALSNEE
jgi:putative transcriptional regulator